MCLFPGGSFLLHEMKMKLVNSTCELISCEIKFCQYIRSLHEISTTYLLCWRNSADHGANICYFFYSEKNSVFFPYSFPLKVIAWPVVVSIIYLRAPFKWQLNLISACETNLCREKMRFLLYLTVLLFVSHDGYCAEYHMSDIISVLTHATVGALESIPRSIPSPSKFFELSKNVLIGFPYEIAYALINDFCMNSDTFSSG